MTTQTTSLTDFLLAQIAKREAHIRADIVGRSYDDPQFELAECEAKRQIVDMHGTYHECTTGRLHGLGVESDPRAADELCPTILALALPYADHSEFREEWRV